MKKLTSPEVTRNEIVPKSEISRSLLPENVEFYINKRTNKVKVWFPNKDLTLYFIQKDQEIIPENEMKAKKSLEVEYYWETIGAVRNIFRKFF